MENESLIKGHNSNKGTEKQGQIATPPAAQDKQ